jgi:hypothetical protein
VRRAALAALLLAVAACRTPPSVPAPDLGDRASRELWAQWIAQTGSREALRGRARLAVERAGESLPLGGKQVLVLARPSRLRVEALGLFNQSLGVLVTDGDRFELFRATDRFYDSGAVGPDLLWREVGIALRPDEAVGVLLGSPPTGEGWQVAAPRDRGGEIHLALRDGEGRERQRLGFDSAGRLALVEQLATDGRVLWRARFGDYRDVEGQPVAHEVRLAVAAGDTRAEIRLADVELNPDLPPDMFQLRLPGGIR